MMKLKETMISQYANSPIICRILLDLNKSIDPKSDIKSFYDLIWNLNTAKEIGLDFWGKVVGIDRNIQIDNKNQFIGSTLSSADLKMFQKGEMHLMNDEMFRNMIFMKAMKNIIYTTAANFIGLFGNCKLVKSAVILR